MELKENDGVNKTNHEIAYLYTISLRMTAGHHFGCRRAVILKGWMYIFVIQFDIGLCVCTCNNLRMQDTAPNVILKHTYICPTIKLIGIIPKPIRERPIATSTDKITHVAHLGQVSHDLLKRKQRPGTVTVIFENK